MKKLICIFVILFLAQSAFALSGISIGPKGGMIFNPKLNSDSLFNGSDQMTLIGGQIRMTGLPHVDILGSVDYAWVNEDVPAIGEFKVHDLGFSVSVLYPIKGDMFKPYFGAGVGYHAFAYTLKSTEIGITIPSDKTYLGYHIMAGLDLKQIGPFTVTGELRMTWLDFEDEKGELLQVTLGVSRKLF